MVFNKNTAKIFFRNAIIIYTGLWILNIFAKC